MTRTRQPAGARPRALTAMICGAVAVGSTLVVLTGSAHADPLAGARARAADLNREVSALTDRAEAAGQRYDAIETRLGGAVNSSLTADRVAEAARQATASAQQRIDTRIQALYADAGSGGLLTTLLAGGDPEQVLTREQVSTAVLDDSTVAVSRDELVAAQAATQATAQHLTARAVTRLQLAAGRQMATVNRLLTTEHSELAHADATVRRLMKQQAEAENAAQSASFDQAVGVAGGHLGGSSTAPNAIAAAAIGFAKTRLGDPYVWGATGPDSFDCSGLTQWAYAHAGVSLPRTAAEQWYSGPHPALSQLEPGDLLFWAFDSNDPASIHHVTIYLGDGMMIAAPHTGENVQIQPVYLDGFFGATRPTAS